MLYELLPMVLVILKWGTALVAALGVLALLLVVLAWGCVLLWFYYVEAKAKPPPANRFENIG